MTPATPIVHVAGAGGECRPALVLAVGPRSIRVRVFVQSAIGEAGDLDYEGDCSHSSDPRIFPNPDDAGGGHRVADAWHEPDSNGRAGAGGGCDISRDRLLAALSGMVGS